MNRVLHILIAAVVALAGSSAAYAAAGPMRVTACPAGYLDKFEAAEKCIREEKSQAEVMAAISDGSLVPSEVSGTADQMNLAIEMFLGRFLLSESGEIASCSSHVSESVGGYGTNTHYGASCSVTLGDGWGGYADMCADEFQGVFGLRRLDASAPSSVQDVKAFMQANCYGG